MNQTEAVLGQKRQKKKARRSRVCCRVGCMHKCVSGVSSLILKHVFLRLAWVLCGMLSETSLSERRERRRDKERDREQREKKRQRQRECVREREGGREGEAGESEILREVEGEQERHRAGVSVKERDRKPGQRR